MYYVYVKDKDGKHVLYGQSQDIFEANEIYRKAKEDGYEYVAIWGNLINFQLFLPSYHRQIAHVYICLFFWCELFCGIYGNCHQSVL